MKIINFLSLSILIFLASGCDFFNIKKDGDLENDEAKPVARVHDQYLYERDLDGLMRKGISKTDSINIAERYINSWIRKQLLIVEAAAQQDFDEKDLEKRVANYRHDLMIHSFEKTFVDKELDREVSEAEILSYYKENLDNFELKQNIIKCTFLKIPKEAPKIQRVKKLISSTNPKEKEELRSYSYRFASSYSLQDSLWINFEEVVANTPFSSIPNKVQFLKTNNYSEMSDDDYTYFLRINDYKISDQTSPLEFVKEQIVNIIINKRKLELAEKLENQVYTKAVNEKDFEIFKK